MSSGFFSKTGSGPRQIESSLLWRRSINDFCVLSASAPARRLVGGGGRRPEDGGGGLAVAFVWVLAAAAAPERRSTAERLMKPSQGRGKKQTASAE